METGEERRDNGRRRAVYCVVPRELAGKLHEPLRRHFRDDPGVEVIVEGRCADRRGTPERRRTDAASVATDRRLIRNAEGRRVSERRAALVPVETVTLPRRLQRHAARLVFVERLEPGTLHAEDVDTARLVTRIQAGDRDAFGDLYMRYFDRVYAYLLVVCGNHHEAEDAAQQVFMKALEALPRYERRSQPFRAWLFVIVRNTGLMHLRRQGRLELLDPAEVARRREAPLPDDDLTALDWISDRELLIFIERLPLAQRQVLLLRYMLGLRAAEIAQVLGRTPNDVSQLQSRAIRFLRARLVALGRTGTRSDRARTRRRVIQAWVLRSRRYALH